MSSDLHAGAAQLEITPSAGVHLSGSGMGDHRPAESVLDPLFAKALVLQSGETRLCLVTLDVTIITVDYTQRIRGAIEAQTGIPPEAILVHATQTHSAPSIGYFMLDPDFPLVTTPETEYLRGAEAAYGDFASEQAIRAAVTACERLQPARLGVGRGMLSGLAFNRRGVRRDGSILMPKPRGREAQPLGLTDLCYLEGPSDPEVGVACLQTVDLQPLAFLLHYTCHPVNVFGHAETYHAVSADWPGAWSRELRQRYGEQVVPLVLNGCCGNQNPWDPFDPEQWPDHLRMGRELAQMSERVTHSLSYLPSAELALRVEHVPLPFREIPDARRREVDQVLGADPDPPRGENGQVDARWFRAATTRSVELCREREGQLAYEVQAFRIGALGIVGLPGEPFVEGQLAIKTRSAAPYVWPTHLTTQYVGYLPTREAYERGGHEANFDVTYWAKLAPGCLETVTARARELVAGLFGEEAIR